MKKVETEKGEWPLPINGYVEYLEELLDRNYHEAHEKGEEPNE